MPFNPVFYSYLFLSQSRKILFVHKQQLTKAVSAYLGGLGVVVKEYEEVDSMLKCVSKEFTTVFASESVSYGIAAGCTFVGCF